MIVSAFVAGGMFWISWLIDFEIAGDMDMCSFYGCGRCFWIDLTIK